MNSSANSLSVTGSVLFSTSSLLNVPISRALMISLSRYSPTSMIEECSSASLYQRFVNPRMASSAGMSSITIMNQIRQLPYGDSSRLPLIKLVRQSPHATRKLSFVGFPRELTEMKDLVTVFISLCRSKLFSKDALLMVK